MILCNSGINFGPLSGHRELTFGIWRWLWVTLELLWSHFGLLWITLGSLWAHFRLVWAYVWSLWADFRSFGITLGWFWGDFGPTFGVWGWLRVALGWLSGDFGTLWGEFGRLWSDFGVTLRLLCGHCGRLWNQFGYIKATSNSIQVTLVRFLEILIFPMDFNDFMQLWAQFWATFGFHRAYLWYMKVALGHFGITLESLWYTLDYFGLTLG